MPLTPIIPILQNTGIKIVPIIVRTQNIPFFTDGGNIHLFGNGNQSVALAMLKKKRGLVYVVRMISARMGVRCNFHMLKPIDNDRRIEFVQVLSNYFANMG